MRKVVNISLPDELNKEVEKAVKSGKYASKSEFFRYLMRLWKEQQLLDEIMESEKEFAKGKGKVFISNGAFWRNTARTKMLRAYDKTDALYDKI